MNCGIFGASSGFWVGWRTAGGGSISVFQSVGGAFIFLGGGGGLGAGLSFGGENAVMAFGNS